MLKQTSDVEQEEEDPEQEDPGQFLEPGSAPGSAAVLLAPPGL